MVRSSIAQPARPLSLTFLVCYGGIASCLLTWADLAEDAWHKEGFRWDAPIALAVHQFHQPWLDFVMQIITQAGETGAVTIALVIAGWWWCRKSRLTAFVPLISLGGAMALHTSLKFIFVRTRPHFFPQLLRETDYSFPSGHAIAAVAVYGLLAVLLWRARHYPLAILAGLLVLLVAISRVYLGVHYPSDVLASLTLGTLWLAAILVLFDWAERQPATTVKQPAILTPFVNQINWTIDQLVYTRNRRKLE